MDKKPMLIMTSKTKHFNVLTATGRKNNNNEEVLKPRTVLDYNSAKKSRCIRSKVTVLHVCLENSQVTHKSFF